MLRDSSSKTLRWSDAKIFIWMFVKIWDTHSQSKLLINSPDELASAINLANALKMTSSHLTGEVAHPIRPLFTKRCFLSKKWSCNFDAHRAAYTLHLPLYHSNRLSQTLSQSRYWPDAIKCDRRSDSLAIWRDNLNAELSFFRGNILALALSHQCAPETCVLQSESPGKTSESEMRLAASEAPLRFPERRFWEVHGGCVLETPKELWEDTGLTLALCKLGKSADLLLRIYFFGSTSVWLV